MLMKKFNTIKPKMSFQLVGGTTSGIEPVFQQYYKRRLMKTIDGYNLKKLSEAIERRSEMQRSWVFLQPLFERFCDQHPNDQELGEKFRRIVEANKKKKDE